MKAIAQEYQKYSKTKVIVVAGSSGKHYAQIRNGAPFEIFFAADSIRPARLEKEGLGVLNSRFTYATGKLVLWSPKSSLSDLKDRVFNHRTLPYIALANPKLAPYGEAAREYLSSKNLWSSLKHKIVRGENIGQTFQFVKTGNAQLGFVALSQVKALGKLERGSFWEVPQSEYSPIKQQAILIKNDSEAKEFLKFIKSDKGKSIIRKSGYEI
jgi:molybdate transport system substrate-binding protein